MSIVLPHSFKDGVDEVASGVQVMDNLAKLVEVIEALETRVNGSRVQGGTTHVEAAALGTGVSTQVINLGSAWSGSHKAFVATMIGDVNSSSILVRAAATNGLGKGIVIPDMGGTSQGVTINWVSVGA